jgi:exonuclease III
MPRRFIPALLLAFAGCTASTGAPDEAPDRRDDAFLDGKADGLCLADGSAAASGVLDLVNDAGVDLDTLDAATQDGGAGLNRRAAANIVAARPIADLAALDGVPWVGASSCRALAAFACNVQRRCLSPLSAMSWNLEHFPKSTATVEAVIGIVDQLAPDVLGVQEIESTTGWNAVIDGLDGYSGVLGHEGDTRVGLMYRDDTFEQVAVEHLFGGDWYAFPRPVLAVRLRPRRGLDATEVVFVVVPLKALSGAANEARRRSAVGKLRTWIAERRAAGDASIVVVGDWNDRVEEPQSTNVFAQLLQADAGVEFLTAELADTGAFSYVPYESLIDHIVVTDELLEVLLDPVTDVIPLEQTWTGDYIDDVTDHRPVRARFGLPIGY